MIGIDPEVETRKVRESIAAIGDVLVHMQVGDDLDAIKGVITKDFTDSAFARGFMLGAESVLKCDGMPTYLSGDGAHELKIRVIAITQAFKIVEFLKKRGEAA